MVSVWTLDAMLHPHNILLFTWDNGLVVNLLTGTYTGVVEVRSATVTVNIQAPHVC